MSGGTPEDGKDAKDVATDSGAKDHGVKDEGVVGGATTPPAATGVTGATRQSEWTASDHRGPLRAPTATDRTADEVERFVPSSEVDAGGQHDAPTSSQADPMPDALAASSTSTTTAGMGATEPPAAASPTQSATALTEPRRSPWPLAASLILGSLIGAGSAALVYNLQAGGSSASSDTSAKLTDLATRVDALKKRPDPQAAIGDVRNEVHALAGRVAALEKRPAAAAAPPQPTPAAPPQESKPAPKVAENPAPTPAPAAPQAAAGGDLAGKVAALQASLDAMGKQDGSRQAAIKDLAGKLEALQGSLTQVQAASRSNAEAVKGQQQDLDGKLAALQGAVSGAQKQASAVQGDLSSVQGSLASVQSEQKALAGKVGAPAIAVAADSLVAQVESGKPYRPQVDALASLGADPARLAVLRENAAAGVPSAQALAASFAPLADPVIATGNRAPADANFGEQLKHGLFGLVNVHRADDTAGNGLASRVALLQADLAHNDVAGAFAAWNALPAEAKAKSSAFGAQLKSSAEAVAAARGLQAQSIDSLAAKKS